MNRGTFVALRSTWGINPDLTAAVNVVNLDDLSRRYRSINVAGKQSAIFGGL